MFAFLNVFYQFLLRLIHVLFTLSLKLNLLKCVLQKLLYNLSIQLYTTNKRNKKEWALIDKTVKTYPKIPKHVVIIVGEEPICYEDFVQIILWCLPSGVGIISFYDHKSEISPELLYSTFAKKHKDLLSGIKWGVAYPQEEKNGKIKDTTANGFITEQPRLQVNVLSGKFGRQLVVDAVKELSERKDIKLDDRKSVEVALENVMAAKFSYSPEPDLLIISGDCFTTYGISPWHISFTEFALIPSYRLLTLHGFLKVLRGFGYCEQKFGK